jgi:hypothetical protein
VRLSGRSSPSTCWKIKYKRRNDTAEIMPGRCDSSITAGQRHVQYSGTLQATPNGHSQLIALIGPKWYQEAPRLLLRCERGEQHMLGHNGTHPKFFPHTPWKLDPTSESLRLSSIRSSQPDTIDSPPDVNWPEALCEEIGRSILLAHIEMSQWILRRVEKVSFDRDRSVNRRIDIDLQVRSDLPVCTDSEGCDYWLVPIAVLNRRTLVSLSLRDEDGNAIITPGLRLTQQLDQSMLLAAAASDTPGMRSDTDAVRTLVQHFIAGERPHVYEAMKRMHDAIDGRSTLMPEATLAKIKAFEWAFRRLERSYTLYVFLRVQRGRHRLISMSFEEPTDWKYERSILEPVDETNDDLGYNYHTLQSHLRTSLAQLPSSLGLRPTRIRFQVPSAEAAASYHFEATAPRGIRIEPESCQLISDRPGVCQPG